MLYNLSLELILYLIVCISSPTPSIKKAVFCLVVFYFFFPFTNSNWSSGKVKSLRRIKIGISCLPY